MTGIPDINQIPKNLKGQVLNEVRVDISALMRYNSTMFGRHNKSEGADTFHGQHFLVDDDVARELANQVPNNATVIEIGAGDGRLTELLARKAKRVIAIETDERMLPKLRDAAKHKRISVVHADALDVDFNRQGKNIIVTGDIPYHITEPLMQKLVRSNVDGAVLVVGGRFADSVTSETSTRRGPLAELVLSIFNVAVLRWIKKESFDPAPRTTSALIKMQRRNL